MTIPEEALSSLLALYYNLKLMEIKKPTFKNFHHVSFCTDTLARLSYSLFGGEKEFCLFKFYNVCELIMYSEILDNMGSSSYLTPKIVGSVKFGRMFEEVKFDIKLTPALILC